MGRDTSGSGSGGTGKSKPGRSTARGAASSSSRAPRGTSTTATTTGRSTSGRAIQPATELHPPTEPSDPNPVEVPSPESPEPGVEAAVLRDLAAIRAVAPELASSTLAASALALAREIDAVGNSATSKSMCAKALLDTLDRLRELMPADEEPDALDAIAARSVTTIAGGSAS